jgi:hypothetical protein
MAPAKGKDAGTVPCCSPGASGSPGTDACVIIFGLVSASAAAGTEAIAAVRNERLDVDKGNSYEFSLIYGLPHTVQEDLLPDGNGTVINYRLKRRPAQSYGSTHGERIEKP